jgi:hypothetical protein
MKVKYVLDALSKFDGEDDVVIAWWDKAWFEYMLHKDVSLEQWDDIVGECEDIVDNIGIGDHFQMAAEGVMRAE